MAKKEKIYRSLPGRGMSVVMRHRLYQGPDHILQSASTGYTETYKRFYYADIQAIIMQKSVVGKIYNAIFGFLAGICLVPGVALLDSPSGLNVVIILWGSIFAFFLLLNLALGPTCVCHLQTAVQTERLAAVSRMRTGRRLLRRLRPLIAQAQGEFQPAPTPQPVTESPAPENVPQSGSNTASPAT